MKFIDQKNARIGWSADEDGVISAFEVIEMDPGDIEPSHFQKLSFTTGNCTRDWEKLTELELTLAILRIFLDYNFIYKEMQKKALLQCAQIKEAVKLREMCRSLYYSSELQYEFEERVYGGALSR